MKRLVLTGVFAVLLGAGVVLSGANAPKMAELKGDRGVKIYLFNGGRPWQGEEVTNFLVKAGLRVFSFDGRYLDGLGGATIKAHPTDRVEPQGSDGFTAAFKRMKPYNPYLVVFHLIPEENYAKIFTPERIAQLKNYVEKGGNVLFFRPFPAGVLDELLPVVPGEDCTVSAGEKLFADRPPGKNYEVLPEKIPVYGFYQEAQLKPGAVALSTIRDGKGNAVAPLIARIQIGKGGVTFCNVQRRLPRQILEYANWAYKDAFFAAVAADCAKTNVFPERLIHRCEDIPAHRQLGEVSAPARLPELGIAEEKRPVFVSGNEIVFANGCKVGFSGDGKANIFAPDAKDPYLKNYGAPQVVTAATQVVFDAKSFEATEVKSAAKAEKIDWKLEKVFARDDEGVAVYVAPECELHWIFKAGKLTLDGRTVDGVGDRAELVRCPYLVNKLAFAGELDLEEPLFCHRNDCYLPPRGYSAFDMTGGTSAKTEVYYGQPFEMIVCKNSLYIGNRSYPEFVRASLARGEGEPFIQTMHDVDFGRSRAPLASHFYWHWLGDGTERMHNDYLAMYQFMRQILRRRAGVKELPGYPVAEYGYLAPEEAEKFTREAAKIGFRYINPPMPESPIEEIASDKNLAVYKMIKNAGVSVYVWTAGSYAQGDGGAILAEHPEWFVRDEKGKLLQYFGTYPVIDLNAPGFYEFCTPILEKAMANGVKWFYRDMDGGAASITNYAVKESPSAMEAQIRFYRFFHAHDCRVSVEGMNPLVLDEYWYRPELYTSFSGKEFSMVGQTPNGGVFGALTLDPFRLAMYGCFQKWACDGAIFGIERFPDEFARSRRGFAFIPKFNEVLDHVGMPFIRETSFGTVWISEKGGALFFWDPAEKVTVDLPENMKIRGIAGNVLTGVKQDSIYFLDLK
ncbi:MAG: hypothetical protein MJ016_02905 [Victivallaceae bacterium]|nr:hypothetical protein [Victivallaceae bacterium]